MDKKQILFTIAFIIATIAIGYILYIVFFAPDKIVEISPPTQTDEEITTDQLPTSQTGGQAILPDTETILPKSEDDFLDDIIVFDEEPSEFEPSGIIDAPLLDAKINKMSNTANFYNQVDGKFYRVDKNGNIIKLSDQTFYNVEKVNWSPVDDKAIIEYPDGSNIFYDFDSEKQVTLPKHWQNFSFSHSGDEVIGKSVGLSPENNWLISTNPEGTQVKLIENMGANSDKVIVDWSPNKQVVGFSKTGEALGADRQEIYLIGANKENFKSIVVEGRDFRPEWSPSGEKIIYSVYSERSDYQPELWIVNSSGDDIGTGRKLLNVNTWADKCTFSDDRFIYCAVPTEQQTGSGIAPDLLNYTQDKIYKIDSLTGIKTEVPLDGYYVIDSMSVTDNNTLFFTDKNKTGLFTLNL